MLDDAATAAVKTISFVANTDALKKFLKRLEGDIRSEISTLDERASFDPANEGRFILGLTLTPRERRTRDDERRLTSAV